MIDPVIEALSAHVPREVSRGETPRDGRKLRWVEAGTGGPTVVLVAGGGGTILDWVTVLPGLAEGSRVIAYDRAGLGASDPVRPLTLDSQIEDLTAILTETGPAVLVGHSWGGLLAQLVAFAHPARIAGLVLIDPSHEDIFESAPWPVRALQRAIGPVAVALHSLGMSGRVNRRMGRRLAARCSDDPRIRALIVDAYVASYASRSHVKMIQAQGRLMLAAHSTAQARAARAGSALPDVPVVVLSATTGLPKRFRERVTAVHAQIAASTRRGHHTIVDCSGHYIHHDQPETVVRTVRAAIHEISTEETTA